MRPAKPAAERDAHTALDLLLETLGRACHELAGVVVEEQDGDGVDTEDVLRADQQLVEQGLEGELGQRGIRQPVDVLELARRALDGRLVADPEEHLALAWRGQGRLGVLDAQRPTLRPPTGPCETVNEP